MNDEQAGKTKKIKAIDTLYTGLVSLPTQTVIHEVSTGETRNRKAASCTTD